MLYYSLVHCYLNYCNITFSLLTQNNLQKLFVLQKKALRLIFNEKYNAHTRPLFIRAKILPLRELIRLNSITFMHAYSFGLLPKSFGNTWLKNFEIGHYNLRNNSDYYIPVTRSVTLKRHPLFKLPAVYNSIQINLKISMSRKKFQLLVKRFLLHKLEIGDNPCVCDYCLPPSYMN